MTDPKQEPITLTERQAFQMLLKTIKAGLYGGNDVVMAAEAVIFCERVIANAPELKADTPSTLGPEGLKAVPNG